MLVDADVAANEEVADGYVLDVVSEEGVAAEEVLDVDIEGADGVAVAAFEEIEGWVAGFEGGVERGGAVCK